jgi:Cof subfamily protein (haloacid dehalogenase superfamily)
MTIALDIDGTITRRDHLIPDRVAAYFQKCHQEGWQFIFVTGRTLSFSMMALNKLKFPYFLALQNGADLLEMPQKKCVHQAYLDYAIIPILDKLYQSFENDFIIYSGYEKGDFAYFRPNHFSPEMIAYLKEVEKLSAEPWKEVDSFETLPQNTFPLIKCIGLKEMLESFDQKLKSLKGIKTTIIHDPISRKFYVTLITHKDADKGKAVQTFMDRFSLKRPLIAGGDDNNDIPLLKKGDVCIAMEGAPEALKNLAHIIAPPGDQMGIIDGLREAICLL